MILFLQSSGRKSFWSISSGLDNGTEKKNMWCSQKNEEKTAVREMGKFTSFAYSTCLYHSVSFCMRILLMCFSLLFPPVFCMHTHNDGGQTLFALITFRSLFTYFCYLVCFFHFIPSPFELVPSHFLFNIQISKAERSERIICCFCCCAWSVHSFEDNKLMPFILYFSSDWFLESECLLMIPPLSFS